MSVRFPYLRQKVSRPVYPLGGATSRLYSVFAVAVISPSGSDIRDCLLDSGADDTIFPTSVAQRLGIDLSLAPMGDARPVRGQMVSYRYAPVTLRVTDTLEEYMWQAIVGFIDAPMRWPLLGQTGFLEYFDALLRGADHEVVLTPNASFTGQHIVH